MNEPFTVKKWGEKNAPCNECTLRIVGCHSNCPKDISEEYGFYGYAAFKKQTDAERKLREEYLKTSDMLMDIRRKRVRR